MKRKSSNLRPLSSWWSLRTSDHVIPCLRVARSSWFVAGDCADTWDSVPLDRGGRLPALQSRRPSLRRWPLPQLRWECYEIPRRDVGSGRRWGRSAAALQVEEIASSERWRWWGHSRFCSLMDSSFSSHSRSRFLCSESRSRSRFLEEQWWRLWWWWRRKPLEASSSMLDSVGDSEKCNGVVTWRWRKENQKRNRDDGVISCSLRKWVFDDSFSLSVGRHGYDEYCSLMMMNSGGGDGCIYTKRWASTVVDYFGNGELVLSMQSSRKRSWVILSVLWFLMAAHTRPGRGVLLSSGKFAIGMKTRTSWNRAGYLYAWRGPQLLMQWKVEPKSSSWPCLCNRILQLFCEGVLLFSNGSDCSLKGPTYGV